MENYDYGNILDTFDLKEKEFIFIYDNLLKELSYIEDIGEDKMLRFYKEGEANGTMYDLGNCPGIVPNSNNIIVGQVFEVLDSKAIEILDEFEGFYAETPTKSEYVRKRIKLNNENIYAWIYYYNRVVDNYAIIKSGSWIDNLNKFREYGKKIVNNNDIEIVEVKSNDGAKLRGLAQKCYSLDIHTQYTYWVMTNYFSKSTFIAKRGTEEIGYIMALYNEEKFFIWQIGILPQYRKQGISYRLIEEAVSVAKSKGFDIVEVTIAEENKSSFNTFAKYTKYNGYFMRKIKQIVITDIADSSFLEVEDMFQIRI
ncbi:GNAT family N-acetyltransferase [Clostridium sp. DL1XJH146]